MINYTRCEQISLRDGELAQLLQEVILPLFD